MIEHSFTEIIQKLLVSHFKEDAVKNGFLKNILDEIILQSKVEFNYEGSIIEE